MWAGSAKGPCIDYLSQDLEKQGLNLAHGLRGYSPSWPRGHGRVHGGRNLKPGLLMYQQNRNQGERIALVCLSSFLIFVIQSVQCPWDIITSLPFPLHPRGVSPR